MLALYDAANGGIDSAPLWRDLMKGGLNPPQMSLVDELRDAVDAAANSAVARRPNVSSHLRSEDKNHHGLHG